MILLDPIKYNQVNKPLSQVTINNLFARTIVEKHLSGKIYVDHATSPSTFHVVHPYGMSLLFGNPNNEEFNNKFRDYALNKNKQRNAFEWLQTFPDKWDAVLDDLFGNDLVKFTDEEDKKKNNIELNTRVNFKFNPDKYAIFKEDHCRNDFIIVLTDQDIFQNMKGSVVPMHFWENSEHFLKNGIGFSLFYMNKLAATAFSAYLHDNFLEIGIETFNEFRGKGLAQYSCAALIDYCIENNLEPLWSCRLENTGSYLLAQKLGFEPTMKRRYYRLCE
jgi:hypothetical protein